MNPWGIDPSAYIVQLAREQFGKNIFQGTIETVDLPIGGFDVVGVFDTFERIYDPRGFVNRASGLSIENGVLAITMPDTTRALARIAGKRGVSLKIPEHVFYWSPRTINTALSDRFRILEIRRTGQCATLSFLVARLLGLRLDLHVPIKKILEVLNRVSIYSDNRSLTVIAARM